MRQILIISAIFGIAFFAAASSYGQCERKKYCDDNLGDFDYRSQSSFGKLSPGDTAKINVVLYGNQDYRIFVCSDPDLGNVSYQVLNPERKTKRYISEIKKDTVISYKTNEYGDYITDDYGELIESGRTVTVDTVWATERYTQNKVVFDSKKNNGKPYFEFSPKKTERFTISISIPGGDPNNLGCVNSYIGRKQRASKSFNKSGQGRYTE